MTTMSWPLFGLRITTPTIELRYVDDEAADALMELAASGVHPPEFMPFSIPWTRFEPPHLQQQGMQHYWRARADHTPQSWHLPFATYVDGAVVGTQSVIATGFSVTRWVETGSWLGLAHQGKGIGKEMRAAVLHFAFESLGAQFAGTGAFHDNASSLGVTRSLGHRENGFFVADREGEPGRQLRFVLERADWEPRRRDDITVAGLEPCRALLGLDAAGDDGA